jgi:hypothetical protein
MRIRLDKELVLKVYCLCREAERSVHRALDANWSDFQEYYKDTKTRQIRLVVESLYDLLGPAYAHLDPPPDEDLERFISPPGIFRFYFGKWLASRKRWWFFPHQSILFLAYHLDSLVSLLSVQEKPDSAHLITLRRAFGACEYIIECRCHGLEELDLAKMMEHFRQTEWLPTVKLADILGEQKTKGSPPAKRSA